MFPLFEVLFIATTRVCLQNIENKCQKLSLFWKARNRFSALPVDILGKYGLFTRETHILVRVYKTMENSKVTVYYYIHVTQIYCGIL